MRHKKNEKIHESNDTNAIMSSLAYLSNEANQSGLDDLYMAIQTLIDTYPELREQNALDPKSEIGLIVNLLIKYRNASPRVKEQFLSYAKNVT